MWSRLFVDMLESPLTETVENGLDESNETVLQRKHILLNKRDIKKKPCYHPSSPFLLLRIQAHCESDRDSVSKSNLCSSFFSSSLSQQHTTITKHLRQLPLLFSFSGFVHLDFDFHVSQDYFSEYFCFHHPPEGTPKYKIHVRHIKRKSTHAYLNCPLKKNIYLPALQADAGGGSQQCKSPL